MITIKIKLVLDLSFVDDWFVSFEGLLVNALDFQQELQQKLLPLHGFLILLEFDVEKGKVAVDVAAAFLIALIGAVDSDDGYRFQRFSFVVLLA